MNKAKFLIFIPAIAALLACGSQDGGGPPELKDQVLTPISPFDTLVVKFNSDINIDKLGDSNIVAENAVLVQPSKNTKELKFIGKNTSLGGSIHFDSDLANDIIEFKNLINTDGYKKDNAILRYSTMNILDDVRNCGNDSENSAVDLDPFFSNFTNSKKIEFAGVLDHKVETSKYNMEDYYKISLRMADAIKIKATTRDSLTVTFTEPSKNSVNRTFVVKKADSLTITIGNGHLDIDNDPANKTADFYIKVSDSDANAPPNPYTLSILLTRP